MSSALELLDKALEIGHLEESLLVDPDFEEFERLEELCQERSRLVNEVCEMRLAEQTSKVQSRHQAEILERFLNLQELQTRLQALSKGRREDIGEELRRLRGEKTRLNGYGGSVKPVLGNSRFIERIG